MKSIELASLRSQDYALHHVIAQMHYWREGSNWIIQDGGRSNTALMALLSVGADYMDVNTHASGTNSGCAAPRTPSQTSQTCPTAVFTGTALSVIP